VKAAVIGSPVSHSLSPAIFEFISLDQGTEFEYSAIEVKPEDHKNFLKKIQGEEKFIGLNVTLPLKELFANSVDSVTSAAKIIGATNVVHFIDQLAYGHNTDVIGIEKTFTRASFDVENSICLLWGAGGSAKAVAYVLGKLKAKKVFVFNRGSRGQELAEHFSPYYPDTSFKFISSLEEIKNESISLMINTTPLGMQGQESGESYFKQCEKLTFSRNTLAFDLIYIPEQTDFLKVAQKLNLRNVGGLGMLIDQALATWEIWVGPITDEAKLHDRLRLFLNGILALRFNSSPIYLSGFMGVGKSTVGKKLAELTKREFIDTDKVIEDNAKLSIGQIFSTKGESEFRKFEKLAIEQVSNTTNSIISLGGGSLNQQTNLEHILSSGTLVYLEADIETLGQRINDQGVTRPILEGLTGDEQLKKISNLLEERKAHYGHAHICVNTVGVSSAQVSFDILSKIGELT
jgi:shikimate dehydrogenase